MNEQRISDVIRLLQALKDKHGDLPVIVSWDAGYADTAIFEIYRDEEGQCLIDTDGDMFREHNEHPDDRAWSTEKTLIFREMDEEEAKTWPVLLGLHGPLGMWSLIRWDPKVDCWATVEVDLAGHYQGAGSHSSGYVRFFELPHVEAMDP